MSDEDARAAAMAVFWAHGYAGTSIDDLQRAMRLQRGSFYLRYPDKRTAFLAALLHYRREIVEPRRELVRRAPNAARGIRRFFRDLVDHSVGNRDRAGCLNTNSIIESSRLSDADRMIVDRLAEGIRNWEDFWLAVVRRGHRDGSIARSLSARSVARRLIMVTQGFNVIAKIDGDRKRLRAFLNAGLSGITCV